MNRAEVSWTLCFYPSIAQHFSLRAFSRSNTTTWLVNRGAFCFSVAGGKLLVHTAVCDFWCCGVVFFYSGWGFVSGSAGLVFQNKTNPEMLLYVEEGLLLLLGGLGEGYHGYSSLPHGKWSSQYIYTSLKPLLKTDDCSFRAQWISINILDCSNWLCAIVMMEIQ